MHASRECAAAIPIAALRKPNMSNDSKMLDQALAALRSAYERLAPERDMAERVIARIHGAQAQAGMDHPCVSADVVRLADYLAREPTERRRLIAARSQSEFIAVLVELGASHHLNFSAATARQVLASFESANDGELSDSQLEAVAGGTTQELKALWDLYSALPNGPKPE